MGSRDALQGPPSTALSVTPLSSFVCELCDEETSANLEVGGTAEKGGSVSAAGQSPRESPGGEQPHLTTM